MWCRIGKPNFHFLKYGTAVGAELAQLFARVSSSIATQKRFQVKSALVLPKTSKVASTIIQTRALSIALQNTVFLETLQLKDFTNFSVKLPRLLMLKVSPVLLFLQRHTAPLVLVTNYFHHSNRLLCLLYRKKCIYVFMSNLIQRQMQGQQIYVDIFVKALAYCLCM